MSILPALCKENPPVTSDHLCWKWTILIEIMPKVIPGEQDIFLMACFIITVTS